MRRGLVLAGIVVPVAVGVAIGLRVVGSGTPAERFHAALAPTQLAPGAGGEATLTKTPSGWRIELDATGLPAPPGRALLRGVAEESRRRARADRDVQRGPERHAVGGRVAEGLPTPDRYPRASRRRSGLVGREGARRCGHAPAADPTAVATARDSSLHRSAAVDPAHDLLAGAVEAAHHRSFAGCAGRGRPPCTRGPATSTATRTSRKSPGSAATAA